MKIFRIKRAVSSQNVTKYVEFKIDVTSPWVNEDLYVNKYSEKHELPIPLYTENKLTPEDYPYSGNAHIVSKRFLDVIKKLNSDFEAFESVVYYKGKNQKAYCKESGNADGKIWDNFYTMIFPEYNLFNWDESDYETDYVYGTNEKFVSRINKLVVNIKENEKISNNNFLILGEFSLYLLCTEKAKLAIEEAGLTGISFEEVEVM